MLENIGKILNRNIYYLCFRNIRHLNPRQYQCQSSLLKIYIHIQGLSIDLLASFLPQTPSIGCPQISRQVYTQWAWCAGGKVGLPSSVVVRAANSAILRLHQSQ